MRLALKALLALLLATPEVTTGTIHATCEGRYLGCFKDIVPAPGVPPVRVINTLLDQGPVTNMTVDGCASACAARGFLFAGITGKPKNYFEIALAISTLRRLQSQTMQHTARHNALQVRPDHAVVTGRWLRTVQSHVLQQTRRVTRADRQRRRDHPALHARSLRAVTLNFATHLSL